MTQKPSSKAWNGIVPHLQKKKKAKRVPSTGKVMKTVQWHAARFHGLGVDRWTNGYTLTL